MSRKYYVITGPKSYFDGQVENINLEESNTFSQLVKESDDCRTNGSKFNNRTGTLIVKNDSYNSIVEQAHDRLGVLIEEFTLDDASVYIHNPPFNLKKYLVEKQSQGQIEIEYQNQDYSTTNNKLDFSEKMKEVSSRIIGQTNAITEISKSMWYLSKTKRTKPYVIMLYGSSSIGKTQLVREIAREFYSNKFFEKHLSMFQNNSYSDYFFGEKPNRTTLGYELLERSSNLIFLDELDKCPEHFYSAFYTLFDNQLFNDATYEVDISGSMIILTSNYASKEEMKSKLGLPIYYRIDKFIGFSDFDTHTIYEVLQKEIKDREDEYSEYLESSDVYNSVSKIINTTGENARTIKYKVQKTIEDLLFQQL